MHLKKDKLNNATIMDKYPAPALEKGLYLLEILNNQGEKKLEELTTISNLPKASVNRYLKTLMMVGYVGRNLETKKFYSLCRIEREHSSVESLRIHLPEIMKELVEATGFTAEWYEYQNESAVITLREEPQNVAVKVLATQGFQRTLNQELDAVARIFIKYYGFPEPMPNYYIRKWDEIIKLSTDEVNQKLDELPENYLAVDKNFNHNGIRRCAIAVFDAQRQLVGTIALAGHYHPSSNSVQQKGIELLKNCLEKLNKFLK